MDLVAIIMLGLVHCFSMSLTHPYFLAAIVAFFIHWRAGGVISLLSLNGLFLLMQEYNLEYPEFYPRLYALLKPNVFHAKYRQRFFRLLDLFLSSRYRCRRMLGRSNCF